MPGAAATFAFLDDLHLEVRGSQRTLHHYRAEYGREGSAAVADPELLIVFQRRLPGVGASFGGAYKGLKWRVELADPAAASLRAAIALTGEPRSFGLSLLQGYVVEPLLALLAPAANHVLLPAAAIAPNRGAILLIGRSRSGKSSLSARAATEGIPVLGDDHVLVGRDGTCRSFPRRLRLYTDLQDTAPHAYRNLPGSQRVLLAALRGLRVVTRGAVAPPLRVPIEAFGPVARDTLPLGLVIVIERGDNGRLERSELDPNALVEFTSMVLREQRTALLKGSRPRMGRTARRGAAERGATTSGRIRGRAQRTSANGAGRLGCATGGRGARRRARHSPVNAPPGQAVRGTRNMPQSRRIQLLSCTVAAPGQQPG